MIWWPLSTSKYWFIIEQTICCSEGILQYVTNKEENTELTPRNDFISAEEENRNELLLTYAKGKLVLLEIKDTVEN